MHRDCPTPETGERIWLVRYDEDDKIWATPERFLAVVAAPLAPPAPDGAEEEEVDPRPSDGKRAQCPARFQRSRPCPPLARD